MSDNPEKVEKQMEKQIFICGDSWLELFHLLRPAKIGLQIALLSSRFDALVDEHFKTRHWTLGSIRINCQKIGGTHGGEDEDGDGTAEKKQMQIFFLDHRTDDWKLVPIADRPVPNKVVGFRYIYIDYVDHNVVEFLCQLRPLFALCSTNVLFEEEIPFSAYIKQHIWPILGNNICSLFIPNEFCQTFLASFLDNYCTPTTRTLFLPFYDNIPVFPTTTTTTVGAMDDAQQSADVSSPNEVALAKWLLTPMPSSCDIGGISLAPKVLKCGWRSLYCGDFEVENRISKIEKIKTSFANASSRANFIIIITCFNWTFSVRDAQAIEPFCVTNALTGEQLALQHFESPGASMQYYVVMIRRCPIARDRHKWAKWEKEAIEWNLNTKWNVITLSDDVDSLS